MTRPNTEDKGTILELTASRSKPAAMTRLRSPTDAAPFSKVGTSQLTQPGSGMTMPGRSSSLKLPVTRTASYRVREWVKRSNSSRTCGETGRPAPETLKGQIKHLGGGRVAAEGAEAAVCNTALVPPGAERTQTQTSPASSADSRVTQWLDFYSAAPSEAGSRQTHPLPKPPVPDRHHGADGDLRPLPLRVPSRDNVPPSRTLARKNSSGKPLPTLPGQPSGARKQLETGPTVAHVKLAGRDDTRTLFSTRYGGPIPTPDSGAGGAARACKDKGKEKQPDAGLDTGREEQSPRRAKTHDPVRHTRHERIWLHLNYHGEAPFLEAWGLDIADVADRLEGLSILQDLIQAERWRDRTTRDNDGTAGGR
ncbi:hypothetical protein BT67DRAFT_458772 [Trichocladium antarcticum]|uniref:Uncharacterized protein n=1 Tax=Trichocladium antarcticum TaxID=1450529 RepID=A0AAN6UCT4_9PEZI|nr:hypothetical protein BT67DRAFT_458772 [Trichocladium antarcticum]